MTIGERIKRRRLDLGLSADEVAAALGKNRATVYRYESNAIEKLPTTVLEPLAEVLETSPAFLMGWTDDPRDYGNDEEYLNAPLDVLDYFNGDPKRTVDFQEAVTRDAQSESAFAEYFGISISEFQVLVAAFTKLNSYGRGVAIDRLCEMGEIKKYTE